MSSGFSRIYINIKRFLRATNRLVIQLYRSLEINELTGLLILAFIVGILGGYGAVAFRLLLEVSREIFWGSGESLEFIETQVSHLSWYVIIGTPAVGGLIVGAIIYYWARETKGSGMPEVLESVATKGGWIRARVIPLKALVSSITIGSGGSAGREGPIVQIGSGTGSVIGQYLNLDEEKRRILVGCGASAGIAGTFNAPIGGMLFSLEVLLGEFKISRFSPLIVSSVMATVISHNYLGDQPAFEVPEYTLVSPFEMVPYLILGICCAFIAILFINSLDYTEQAFNNINVSPVFKPAIGGLLIGGIAYFLPHISGVGYPTLENTLTGEYSLGLLCLLAAGKIVATNLTLGSGGSGGVFAPSLFVGAAAGGVFGRMINMIAPGLTGLPGSYALVGMGAVVAGTAHAPLTAILILFEMTRDYHIILPLMLSCIISSVVAMQLQKESIYTQKLIRRGIDIQQGSEAPLLRSVKAWEVMNSDVISLTEGADTQEIIEVFRQSHHTHYPVVEQDSGRVIGILNYTDYWDYIEAEPTKHLLIARDLARTPAVTITTEDNLLTAMRKISNYETELLPVTDVNTKKLVGVVSRNDIIDHYNQLLYEREGS